MYQQAEHPTLQPLERSRPLFPPYDFPLEFSEVKQSDWRHVCPCRFGLGRGGDGSKWNGDCYRYDIFIGEGRFRPQYALRWWNGSGEGWLIEEPTLPGQRAILEHIATLPDESLRWDLCHALWQTAHKTALAATRTEHRRMGVAFLDKKLKRRQRTKNGTTRVWVEVQP